MPPCARDIELLEEVDGPDVPGTRTRQCCAVSADGSVAALPNSIPMAVVDGGHPPRESRAFHVPPVARRDLGVR